MKGKRYTEEQIVGILREVEGGRSIAEVCPGIGQGRVYTREEIERLARERERWIEG